MLKDSGVHITYEDQQKINKFARLNAKMDDIKDEMKLKEVSYFYFNIHILTLICFYRMNWKI